MQLQGLGWSSDIGWLRQALIIVHILSLFLTSSANAHGSTCKVPIKFRTGVVRTPLCCCGSCALAKEGEEEFNIQRGEQRQLHTNREDHHVPHIPVLALCLSPSRPGRTTRPLTTRFPLFFSHSLSDSFGIPKSDYCRCIVEPDPHCVHRRSCGQSVDDDCRL